MMYGRLGRSANVALFLAFNLALLALTYLLIARPAVVMLSGQKERLETRIQELARYRALAGQEVRVRELLGSVSPDRETALFLAGADDGGASAFLQAHLRSLADRAGLQIRSMSAPGTVTRDNIRQIGVRLDASGPIGSIHELVSAVEASVAPVLFIDALTIRAPESAGTPLGEPHLNVQVTVSGVQR